jgi:hypothetical protein
MERANASACQGSSNCGGSERVKVALPQIEMHFVLGRGVGTPKLACREHHTVKVLGTFTVTAGA